ncbi:tRNA epoxyqueuosine(34) reductase QueG [Rhizobium sp. TRM95796]|uniref:tRNA epoxyqueuosine(34) reductase QueG n=1 Tax=Rhizobium sp. TRM95796 TaxID=2979862 RepID=UPI0021E80C6C|nr:tRNA epoxyqueuosine(34) reductase QueG [Rhizobium sp. TRM95796]MCV3768401.1 tRNA epoxyqueuosine(34) reductase QueG [Rhizobium sp. TRM95796]
MSGAASRGHDIRGRAHWIKTLARETGFDICHITGPDDLDEARADLGRYIEAGYHGTMAWMPETQARRGDPRVLWPDVRSIIMLGMNYGPEGDPRDNLARPEVGNISVYARHRDYHDVIKGKLKEIAQKFAARTGAEVKVFVDTAPVMEKPLAAKAGLGWQGKHTNLVNRDFGSWLFLGSIFTAAELEVDPPERDHCGSCRACLDACPTGAFPSPYRIDARRCVSYLTIEHKGPIDREIRPLIGNRIYGCDDCLAACPWNKFAEVAREQKLRARRDLGSPLLADLLKLDDAAFRALFSGSPVKRIGRNRFIRNCLIAAGNSGDLQLAESCRRLLSDQAAEVRGMAIWALAQLGALTVSDEAGAQREPDDYVREEWKQAGLLP